MEKLREVFEDLKLPLGVLAVIIIVSCILGFGACALDAAFGGPSKPEPVRETVNWEVDRFQTTTVGGRKVTCFTRGARGGLSCVPEVE